MIARFVPLVGASMVGAALAAPAPDTRHPVSGAMFPTYASRAQIPAMWDEIAVALRNADVSDDIVTVRVRPTAVWTARIDLRENSARGARWAIVGFERDTWKVLCVTSPTQDCRAYAR